MVNSQYTFSNAVDDVLFEIAQSLPSTMREKSGDRRADHLGARGWGLWVAMLRKAMSFREQRMYE